MKLRIMCMLLALSLGGCASQVPLATNHALTTQKKLKSAHHWDVIADDVANQTMLAFSDRKLNLREKTFHIKAPVENTSFNKAFRNFLVTRMVNRGMPVSKEREGAQEIEYELQLVRHDSSRYAHIPGTFTALAAGVSVLRDIFSGGSAAIPAALGLSALADYGAGYYSGGPTPTELIITTSMVNGNTYTLRKSDVYYIEDADTDLFVDALERPVKQWQVVGK